jgi:predicted GNAT family acetyltransferase
MATEVVHEAENNRYTIWRDGDNVGLADYRIRGNVIQFTHTEVNPALRGHGLAGALIQSALDDVRSSTEFSVAPICGYVADWIDAHPDYQDLLNRAS